MYQTFQFSVHLSFNLNFRNSLIGAMPQFRDGPGKVSSPADQSFYHDDYIMLPQFYLSRLSNINIMFFTCTVI